MQFHTARCSDSQKDPENKSQEHTPLTIIHLSLHIFSSLRQQPLTASPDTFGSRFSCGTSTSSIRIMPVADALSENFPSIFGVEKPFIPRSRMKPRTLPSSHLAQTTAMSAKGEFVILTKDGKIYFFLPLVNFDLTRLIHLL